MVTQLAGIFGHTNRKYSGQKPEIFWPNKLEFSGQTSRNFQDKQAEIFWTSKQKFSGQASRNFTANKQKLFLPNKLEFSSQQAETFSAKQAGIFQPNKLELFRPKNKQKHVRNSNTTYSKSNMLKHDLIQQSFRFKLTFKSGKILETLEIPENPKP